jgi:hypothetical protein
VQSDGNGLASFLPSTGAFTAPLMVETQVSAGVSAAVIAVVESFPPSSGGDTSVTTGGKGSASPTVAPDAPWHMPIALPARLLEY